jgi:hypothetical protein
MKTEIENKAAARKLVEDIYRDMQRSISTSLDSDVLWEGASRLGHAVILDDKVSGRIEGFVRERLPKLVLEYIAHQCKVETHAAH